jgi:hypothetical protein
VWDIEATDDFALWFEALDGADQERVAAAAEVPTSSCRCAMPTDASMTTCSATAGVTPGGVLALPLDVISLSPAGGAPRIYLLMLGITVRVVLRAHLPDQLDRIGFAGEGRVRDLHPAPEVLDPVQRRQAALAERQDVRIQPAAVLDGDEHCQGPAVPLDDEALARGGGVEHRPKAPAQIERCHDSHG